MHFFTQLLTSIQQFGGLASAYLAQSENLKIAAHSASDPIDSPRQAALF
ncbi:MAG: hypothetical protein MUF72_08900 [Elainella sp. Prado103]|jgi:hypothetical protein|nr:hypothetical protein [Elainella sp. Prado103]